MVKPSEVCVHTAKVMEELLPVYLDKVLVSVSSLPPSPSVFHSFSMDSFEWGLSWPTLSSMAHLPMDIIVTRILPSSPWGPWVWP